MQLPCNPKYLCAVSGVLSAAISSWRAKEEKGVNMLNAKGFWEGGVIPNTCGEVKNLSSFQL